jgi:ferric-dicitrate binding protein FerR (iron transport regulator)
LFLIKGEKGTLYNNSNLLEKSVNTNPNFLAWKTKVITFEATPLGEVLKTLEQTYHTSFRPANKETLNCRVTVSFDHEPLEGVLSTLSTILDVSFEKRKEGYTVEGRGCRE